MILRRLTDAIRKQDWFQVTVEILIVVIGIFLGLQVTEWNEGRVERTQEVNYLQRLLIETTRSLNENESAQLSAYNMWKDAQFIVTSLSSCTLMDQGRDRFARGLWFTGKFQSIELSNTVVEELKSTGQFQLIQNVKLREALTDLESEYNNTVQINGAITASLRFHLGILESNYSYKLAKPDLKFPLLTVTWKDTEIDFQKLCKNEQFKSSLIHVFRYVNSYFAISRTVLEKQRNVIKMLEAELGGKQ